MVWILIMAMLWNNDPAAGYNRLTSGAPAYLAPAEQFRWEKLRVCKMLHKGDHACYFLDESRTQFDFPDDQVQDRIINRYITFNLLRLVSIKTADLLFSSKSKLTASLPAQKDQLDLLARRSFIHSRFHGAAVQASWAGGAFIEAMVWRGESYIDTIPPDEMYPQGDLMPNGQYERYVRYATQNVGTDTAKIILLLETSYEPGLVRRRVYQLDERKQRQRELALNQWPQFATDTPLPEQRTGLPDNTITYMPNVVGGDQLEQSDYDGLIQLQDSVNAKFSQVARILAKHANLKLAAPRSVANQQGQVPARAEVFFFDDERQIPRYIPWPADLAMAMQDRVESVDALCVSAEMSPVLLGIIRGAAPDSARKLMLTATNSLAKVARKSMIAEPAIARSTDIAQRLDQTSSLRRTYPVEPIGVEMRPGLPVDEVDEATVISTLRGANVMSIESGVARWIDNPDAVAPEVQKIEKEEAEKAAPFVGAVTSQTDLGSATGEPAPSPAQQEAA